MKDMEYMQLALEEARKAFEMDEVPVGALVVKGGIILSRAHNLMEALRDPTAHAEVLAIREASARLGNWRLEGATLYVTKEPCPMCAGAIVNARVSRVVYGCRDEKGGAADSLYRILSDKRLNHQAEAVSGLLSKESARLLKEFFRNKRNGPGIMITKSA
ncbi:tRNA-specific adenosine-34 deaminase [hydrothermal vent metagenome]|uniref:tRNA-specific adenosine deaminase 2 n=1 Tax=hydrothermal vent metagenome TaxID=652676 RepID=A0A3B1CV71_9ZZZZ